MSSTNKQTNRPIVESQTKFKSNYSPKQRVALTFPENSPWTKQEFKEECDINTIMNQYMATGQLPSINENYPQYLDVTGIEFQESMEFIAGAQSMFHELPSAIRNRFQNDPAQFLDFCSQEKNRPELAEMGLLKAQINQPIPSPQPLQTNSTAPLPVVPPDGGK